MSIQVKCYLFPSNILPTASQITKANEIRRFNLSLTDAQMFSNNYEALMDKILSTYGPEFLPVRSEVRTYWLDEENELVGFSTPSELKYAIDLHRSMASQVQKPYESKAHLFKVYIAAHRRMTTSSSSPLGDHMSKSGFSQTQPEEVPELHPNVYCDGCTGPIAGMRYKCTSCADYDLCSSCEAQGVHKETGHSFAKIAKPLKYWRIGQGCSRRRGCPMRPQSSSSGASSFNSSSSSPTLNDILPGIAAHIPVASDPEQLKNFGEYLKRFLDPLGVDLDFFVETKDDQQKPKTTTTTPKPTDVPKKPAEEPKIPEPLQSKQSDLSTSSSSSFVDTSMEVPIEITSTSTISGKEQQPQQKPALITSISEDSDSEMMERAPYEKASQALKMVAGQAANTGSAQAVIAPAMTSTLKQSDYSISDNSTEPENFHMVDIEKELRIIKAIEQLKLMGYSDDSGWLTQLCIAKNGQINAVLDAINPNINK